jgi:hypothetical protein
LQNPPQWFDLAYTTALLSLLDRLVETVGALLEHQLFDVVAVRKHDLDSDPEVISNAFDGFVRLLMQASGIQREDSDIAIDLGCEIDQHDIFDAETRRNDETLAERVHSPGENFVRRLVPETVG